MKTKNLLYIFIAILFLATLVQLFIMALRPPGATATIYQDTTPLKVVYLDRVDAPFSFTVTGPAGEENVVRIRPGEIFMESATCPDQICVRQGPITDGSFPIVCMPHRILIQIGTASSDLADAASGG